MSVQAMSWVFDHSKAKSGSLVVLLCIANHAHADGRGAWPSIQTLARESRLSDRQVQHCIRQLEKSGELKTEKGAGPNGTNLYSLPLFRGEIFSPPPTGSGAVDSKKGCSTLPKRVLPTAPEPSLTIKENRPSENLPCSERFDPWASVTRQRELEYLKGLTPNQNTEEHHGT